tara:strand:+ start:96 stop:464 length:369 start_codon:yes stop_codon:yes gene_type:complete
MATFLLAFPVLNISVQPTDVVYACLTDNNQAGVNTPNPVQDTKPFPIGVVIDVNHGTSTIEVDDTGYVYPSITNIHYFFFSKDRRANMSGILGNYALVEYRNYSKKQAEIFATGAEFAPSSK